MIEIFWTATKKSLDAGLREIRIDEDYDEEDGPIYMLKMKGVLKDDHNNEDGSLTVTIYVKELEDALIITIGREELVKLINLQLESQGLIARVQSGIVRDG